MQGQTEDKIEAIPANYTESKASEAPKQNEVVASVGTNEDVSVNYVERAKREMARMNKNESSGSNYTSGPSSPIRKQTAKHEQTQTEKPSEAKSSNDRVVRRESPTSSTTVQTPELKPRKKKLAYVVQLSASSQKLRSGGGKWNKVQNEILIRFENDLYKYQVGEIASYEEALSKKADLRKIGFKDCFIVAYYDDAQINIKEAARLSE